MKKSIVTVIFMIIITIVFISALASINEITREQITQNMNIERSKSILYSFNIFPDNFDESMLKLTSTTSDITWQQDEVLEKIESNIEVVTIAVTEEQKSLLKESFLAIDDSVKIYVKKSADGTHLAYGFGMKGKGLWGTITAFGVISSDLTKMIGIDFTEQVETPGLGARILEEEYKYFFRNLDLNGFFKEESQMDPVIMVKQKTDTNVEKSTNSVQAITGATQTVNGVLKMINTDLRFYIDIIQSNPAQFRT